MTKLSASYRKPQRVSRRWPRWSALMLLLIALFLVAKLIWQHLSSESLLLISPENNSATAAVPVQFDFYTVLPKMAVVAPAQSPASAAPAAPPAPKIKAVMARVPPAKPVAAEIYILQIAALRQLEDAQHLRDQMRAAGYPAFVQSYQADQAVWYRVMLGPYASAELAQHTQELLKSRHMNSFLLKSQSTAN